MAAKVKAANRLENEIFKCRDESNWKKIQELAEQLQQRSAGTASEVLANFLIGESKLEQYLEENPPTEANIPKAKTGLGEAKRYLGHCFTEAASKHGVSTDAHFLMAKILYAQGIYDEAIKNLDAGGLDRLDEKLLSSRILKILAESFAIKGLCLDKLPEMHAATGKLKQQEKDELVIRYFVQAGDMALKYLQEVEKSQGVSGGVLAIGAAAAGAAMQASQVATTTEHRIGHILETSLQRAPIYMMKMGRMADAIEQYRNVLRAEETSSTQTLRMHMALQLTEVFLRGVCENAYYFYLPQLEIKKQIKHWKPTRYTGQTLFLPKEESEEILLLLSIAEQYAVRNAVLDRSPEFREARISSYRNVTAVFDLLSAALCRHGQYGLLCDSFERAMKFAFEEYHVWFQFAISLLSNGKFARAVLLLRECGRLRPNSSLPLLLAAKTCLDKLKRLQEGLELAQEALTRELKTPDEQQPLLAQCYLVVGVAHSRIAEERAPIDVKHYHRVKSFDCLSSSRQADSTYHLAEFFLALHYADLRQIPAALRHARRALTLYPEHVASLQLLVLLLSAQKQHSEALALVQAALEEYPDDVLLLYIKAYVEDYLLGAENALFTAKNLLKRWRFLYEQDLKFQGPEGLGHRKTAGSASESIVPGAHSTTGVSRVEQALSEAMSAMTTQVRQRGVGTATPHLWQMQLHIWLLVAELYIKQGHYNEAESSIVEASNIFPISHELLVTRGVLHEARKEYLEAKQCYQNAIAINPFNVKALQHLGMVYHYLGSTQLAEKTLRDAVAMDPMSHQSWYNMGVILQEAGDFDASVDCINTAIQLEATTPILPFSHISRIIE